MESSDLASQLDRLIGFGRYQVFLFLLYQYSCLTMVVDQAFMVFGAITPNFKCNGDNSNFSTICTANCSDYEFENGFHSIVVEWDLVCSRKYVVSTITSVQMFGILIGAPTFGQLSEVFGRKWTVITSHLAMVILGCLSPLSPNWMILCVFRFFIGLFGGGAITTSYVLQVEFSSKKLRFFVIAVGGWPIGFLFFALVAYLTESWKMVSVIGNVAAIFYLIPLFFVYESPRWLVQHHRLKEAKEVLINLNRFSNKKIELTELDTILPHLESDVNRKKKIFTFRHLFHDKTTAIHVLVLCCTWFIVSMASYGLLFNISDLGGSKYLNMTIFAVLRLITSTSAFFADMFIKRFGRKQLHFIPAIVIIIACVMVTLIFQLNLDKTSYSWSMATTLLCLIAGCFCTPVWTYGYLMSAELVPTSIRNLSNSFCSTFARFGAVLSPWLLYVGKWHWAPFPFVCFAILFLIDLLLSYFFIPETKGKPLPEAIEKSKTKRNSKCLDSVSTHSATSRSNSFTHYKFTTTTKPG